VTEVDCAAEPLDEILPILYLSLPLAEIREIVDSRFSARRTDVRNKELECSSVEKPSSLSIARA
jgi:hypothetical protein